MEKRDLIKDQIEQLGKVLGKILADFLGLKTTGFVSPNVELSNQQLKTHLDIDVVKLLELDKVQTKEYLVGKNLTAEHIETLSKYLEEVGMSLQADNRIEANRYLAKSLLLIDLANELSKSISFERINQKTRIENFLHQGK